MKINKSKILIVATLFVLALASCDDREPWQRLLEQSEIELLDQYKIDSTVLQNTNEYNWVAYLDISNAEEKRIIKQIEKELEFKKAASIPEYKEKYTSDSQVLYGYILNSQHHFGWQYDHYKESNGTKQQVGFISYEFEFDTGTNKFVSRYWND